MAKNAEIKIKFDTSELESIVRPMLNEVENDLMRYENKIRDLEEENRQLKNELTTLRSQLNNK